MEIEIRKQTKNEEIIMDTNEGYVYFIKCGEFVKIGHVKKNDYIAVMNRYKVLKTGMPHPENEIKILYYESGGEKRERELHELFIDYRVRSNGEWFYFSDEIKKYLNKG